MAADYRPPPLIDVSKARFVVVLEDRATLLFVTLGDVEEWLSHLHPSLQPAARCFAVDELDTEVLRA